MACLPVFTMFLHVMTVMLSGKFDSFISIVRVVSLSRKLAASV